MQRSEVQAVATNGRSTVRKEKREIGRPLRRGWRQHHIWFAVVVIDGCKFNKSLEARLDSLASKRFLRSFLHPRREIPLLVRQEFKCRRLVCDEGGNLPGMSCHQVKTNQRTDAAAKQKRGCVRQRCQQAVCIVAMRLERQTVAGSVDLTP